MFSPYSATPISSRDRENQLSVSIPNESIAEHEEQNERLDNSLRKSWKKAADRFKSETGEDLGDFQSTKTGILGNLKHQYGSDSKEAKKRDEIYGTVEMILNGVEVVAATAGQVAAMMWGPAQLCFNAFDLLLSIPKAIKKFHDEIQALFKEICDYLKNFKVFDRIDRRGMLDAALLTSNSDILIALVEMVMLAWKVIKSPIRAVLGNVFLKNDAIGGALSNFRGLVANQNQLTSTMTLEAVLKSESLSRQIMQRTTTIENTTKDTNVMVRDLAADSTENKNLRVDKDRILRIDRYLDLSEVMVHGPLDELRSMKALLFDEMSAHYKDHPKLKEWRESSEWRRILYIYGETGSGKTNVLSALAQEIQNQRKNLHAQQAEGSRSKDERGMYITYYSFSQAEQTQDRGQFDTPAHTALKTMAAQLARQSTRYARDLSEGIEAVPKGQQSLQKLWHALKFSDFSAPADSVLYMLFDGLDQLGPSLQELGKTLKASKSRKIQQGQEKSLEFRIAMTGKEETSRRLGIESLSLIAVSEINQPLIGNYVENELRHLNIFQDDDEESAYRKKRVVEIVQEWSDGSFGIAKQKLKMVEEAVEQDSDYEVLVEDLQAAGYDAFADEGRQILERLDQSVHLSVGHKAQLREILMWSIYGLDPTPAVLEAALYLQHDKKPLEPLDRKFETRFKDFLEIRWGYVNARASIKAAIQTFEGRRAGDESGKPLPKVTVNVSGDELDDISVRPLMKDLRNRLAGVNFDLISPEGKLDSSQRIIFSEIDAQYIIIVRLLRALNDDRIRQQAAPLIHYAINHLPYHLSSYRKDVMDFVPLPELKMVVSALINFLWDTESSAFTWDSQDFRMDYMTDSWLTQENIDNIKSILGYHRLQYLLDPVQRRWIAKNVAGSERGFKFLESMAKAVAGAWLATPINRINPKGNTNPWDCFSFIDRYIELVERSARTMASQEEILAGNFSSSSRNIKLVDNSILFARCESSTGEEVATCIDLNDCLIDTDGLLRWSSLGGAFDRAIQADISSDGTILNMHLWDNQYTKQWHSINLDEQISNQDGKLVFLNTAKNSSSIAVDDDTFEPLPLRARITRVESWAAKKLNIVPDSQFFTRIGSSLLDRDDDLAVEYFNKAEPQDASRAIGLSLAHANNSEIRKALELLQDAISILRLHAKQHVGGDSGEDQESDSVADDKAVEIGTCLTNAAKYQETLKNGSAAVELLEEALTYQPFSSEIRWQLIKLLYQTDQHARAEKQFDAWEETCCELNDNHPRAFIRSSATPWRIYDELWPLLQMCVGTKIYDRILKLLGDALDMAEASQEENDSLELLYAQGLIYACNGSQEYLKFACRSWVDAVSLSQDLEDPDVPATYWSSKLAAMYYFDHSKEQLDSSPKMANNEVKALFENLRKHIVKLMSSFHQSYRGTDRPTGYIAAFARLTGQLDVAREILKPDMTDALDILSDDDVENDGTGIRLLFEILLRYGDVEGASSAFSLLDRNQTRPRLQQKLKTQQDGRNPPTKPEQPIAEVDDVDGNIDKNEESNGDTASTLSIASHDTELQKGLERFMRMPCDFCNTLLESDEEDTEMWWCRYCGNVTFCRDCRDKLKRGERTKYVCNPKHDLVLFKHQEYTEEELEGDNVLIGFKLQDVRVRDPGGPAGALNTVQERVGGKIVDMAEWVNMLRREWDIKETKMEGTIHL